MTGKTPLEKKLGLKDGMDVLFINAPENFTNLFTNPPEYQLRNRGPFDYIQIFTKSQSELLNQLPKLKKRIRQNGYIWVSWPKRASKVATDIKEDTIRDYAIEIGLVDVKVCSIDLVWSALKLVIPLKYRTS